MVEAQPPDNPTPGLSPFSGAFVGRRGELDDLKVALEESLAGHSRLVMLAGEPGIGKTRTAQEPKGEPHRVIILALAPPCWVTS